LNTCYNALDRHVHAGLGAKKAIIYDSPVTNTIQWYTYRDVIRKVQEIAGVLVQKGVKKGDRVLIYMPNIPETIFAMLACARIGAVHSVVFGGFSAHELCVRIDDAKPVMVFTASCGVEGHRIVNYKQILDDALIEAQNKPKNVLVFQRSMLKVDLVEGRDWNWEESVARVKPFTDCVDVESSDPSYLLYTSGTSGKPKGILRDTGGHAVALHWSMRNIYNVEKDDVFWAVQYRIF
jgi:propionyl-CoA synthetase